MYDVFSLDALRMGLPTDPGGFFREASASTCVVASLKLRSRELL
jgi:hypothetical protein